jgi:hypothetical protein
MIAIAIRLSALAHKYELFSTCVSVCCLDQKLEIDRVPPVRQPEYDCGWNGFLNE